MTNINTKIKLKKDTAIAKSDEERDKSLAVHEKKALSLIDGYDYDLSEGSAGAYMTSTVFVPCSYFESRKGYPLEEQDYVQGFKLFEKLVNEINMHTIFVPTLKTFARFMNITEQTLKYTANENSKRGEIATMIIDTLSDRLMQNMLNRKIDAIPSIFIAKANFGMRDNDSQNINILNVNTAPSSVEDILKEYAKNQIG